MLQTSTSEMRRNKTNVYGRGNWALFFGSIYFFMANLFASIAIFPAYSLAIGSTPFQAGLQSTVFALTAVLARFFLGPVMDRQGPKPLMIVGMFVFATTPLLLLINDSYAMLLLLRAYQSIGLAVVLPGISTLAAEMATEGRIGAHLGATRIFFNLGLLSGPAAALYLIETFGYPTWFIVSSLAGISALGLLAAVKTPAVTVIVGKVSSSWTQLAAAMNSRVIYPIIIAIAVFSFTYSAVISFAAVYIEETAPGSGAAYFFVILGLAGITASLGAGLLSDRYGRQNVAWPLLVVMGLGTALFYFFPLWPFLIIICAFLIGIGIQGSSLVFTAWLIDIAKPGLRATTISIQENTIDILFALGALIFGLAAQGPGLGFAFLVSGILTVAVVFPLRKKSIALQDHAS
jgi:MFS family permease